MKSLPLYTDRRAIIEKAELLTDTDKACTRCTLHKDTRSVCLGADGQNPDPNTGFVGAVLVLGDFPTQSEDSAARPVSCGPNTLLREIIERAYPGPVVFASAIRCAPNSRNITELMVKECRGYTRGLIEEIKPSRILCMGKHAYWSVLGSACDSIQLGRRGYGYLSDETPVFMLHAARRVTPNRFLFARWENDIQWALTAKPDLPPWDAEILEVQTRADAELAAADLAASNEFTFDTETGGLMGGDYFQVVCLTATPAHNLELSYLWTEEALKDPELLAPLKSVLSNGYVGKVGHSLKYDFEASAHGLDLMGPGGILQIKGAVGDTLLWVKSIDTECKPALDHADHRVGMGGHKAENKHALDAACRLIAHARTNPKQQRFPKHTHPALTAAVRNPKVDAKSFAYALIPREILYRYCARDTVATARLHKLLKPAIFNTPHRKLLNDVLQCPPTEAVAQMESWGMSADIDAAHAFGRLLKPRRDEYLSKVRAHGCDVDLNSPAQLSEYLFGTLGLPVQDISRKTQAPSTNAESLRKLVNHHPVIQPLLDFAKVDKLINTYVDGLIPHIRPDGRIRSTLAIGGARSGRTSSSNPNLQNIPSAGEYAKMAKNIFNCPPGHVIIQLDYSQLEVRIAAMLSQDVGLIQAYIDGVDVHRRTASKAFNTLENDVTKEQRRNAKAVVFGVLYGKSAAAISRDLGLTQAQGQAIYDSVLGAFPQLTQWMADQRAYCLKNGVIWTYVPTAAGVMERARCRQLWQIAEPDSLVQSTARNGAVNCLDAKTEALTRRGWVPGFELTLADELLTKNPVTGALEWQRPTDLKFWPDYEGPLVEFQSRSFHAVTTPEHRWLVTDKASGEWCEKTSKTLSRWGDHRIHRTGVYTSTAQVHSDAFVWLAGWFLTDGYKKKTRKVTHRPGKRGPKPGTPRSGLCQLKEPHRADIRRGLEQLQCAGKIDALVERPHSRNMEMMYWEFRGEYSAKLWELFPDRELTPAFLSTLSTTQLNLLRDTMLRGDGHVDCAGKTSFYTGSKAQADAFQMLVTLTGQHARCFWRDMSMYTPTSAKMANSPKSSGCWHVTVCKRDQVQVLHEQVREFSAAVGVWCPVVPNSFFVARRGEHVFVTGNTPVQGSASDYMLRTIVAVVNWILGDGIPARVTNTVHDNIILECPFDWALEVAGVTKGLMEGWPACGVPLVADLEMGRTWGAMHSIEGIQVVAQGDRNGFTDDEIIRILQADSDLSDEIGSDHPKWLSSVRSLISDIGA